MYGSAVQNECLGAWKQCKMSVWEHEALQNVCMGVWKQ